MAESNNKNNTPGESDKLIDFTVIKLKQLAKEFKEIGDYQSAKQVEDCLESHIDGDIDIIWRDGLPYVKIKPTKEPAKP